ncbi:MAG: hypothetical protein JSU58_02750 [Dehalococcoidales bacterium]|nr:MAG: hypothetical protein JSU58_02750 [Dehalococcoidales bacterium]
MKKVIAVIIATALILALVPGVAIAKSPKTEFDACGPHYNLNLVAKEKEMPGDYDNPSRHTMFVPLDTSQEVIMLNQTQNNGKGNVVIEGGEVTGDNVTSIPGIRIDITQGPEFAMIDGNATNDSDGDGYLDGAFEIGPGQYDVYIAVRAKSPKYTDEEANTYIAGWIEGFEENGDLWYYLNVGSVNIKKNGSWVDATDLFFVSQQEDPWDLVTGDPMWVFGYMALMDAGFTYNDVDYDFSNLAYFWQFDNHGNKLIQVRFYPRD